MTAAPADRNRELARIHCLAKELGLAREEYEDVLFTQARVRSAGDLDHAGRRKVIEHLAARVSSHGEWAFIARAAQDRQAMLSKIRNQVGARGKRYADGMAQHMFAVDRIEFCVPDQLRRIVAALEYDGRRRDARAKAQG